MNLLLILILLYGVLLLVLGIQAFRKEKYYSQRYTQFATAKENNPPSSSSYFSILLASLIKIGELNLFKSFYTPSFKKQIIHTGWLNKKAPELFIGSMVVLNTLVLIFLILAINISNATAHALTGNLSRQLFTLLFFIYFCRALPKIILDQKKKAFVKTMIRQLPDFFELFLINITAGKSTNKALQDSAEVIKSSSPQVARQINYLVSELKTHPNSSKVWQHFSLRVDNLEIRDAIKIIHHCDTLGLPLSHDLQVQIEHIRQAYLTKIEEKINKLPTKLLLPMTLFIFPSLFIIVLAPALIKVFGLKGLLYLKHTM